MSRVVHFEIHADDPARAQRFYETLLGWRFNSFPELDYWMIQTGDGPGIDGGMMRRRGPRPDKGQPINSAVCVVGVEDISSAFAAAIKAGASEALPISDIPGVGQAGYFYDTEGNLIGLFQPAAGDAG
jgi:uncharacterized protein